MNAGKTVIEKIDRKAFIIVLLMQAESKWSWIMGWALEILKYANENKVIINSYEGYKTLRQRRLLELNKADGIEKKKCTTPEWL